MSTQNDTILSETTGDVERNPPAGRVVIVMVGVLLMGLQLWLLTIALDLYLSGRNEGVWQLALTSGLIFLGGIFVWRIALLRRK